MAQRINEYLDFEYFLRMVSPDVKLYKWGETGKRALEHANRFPSLKCIFRKSLFFVIMKLISHISVDR